MSNETEKVCLNGMIEYVESKIEHNEKKIFEIRSVNPLFTRSSKINEEIQKLEGEITRFRNVLSVLRFNEDHGVKHVHVDRTWIPETEKIKTDSSCVTFVDLLDDD